MMEKTYLSFLFYHWTCWRKSSRWDDIKDSKRPWTTPLNLPHRQYTKKCMGCVSTFSKPSKAERCVSSLSIVTDRTFSFTSGLDLMRRRFLDFSCSSYRRINIMTKLDTHTVDFFFFNREGQLGSSLLYWRSESNMERFVQNMSSFIFKALASWGVLCSGRWQRRFNMKYGLITQGHRCCAEEVATITLGFGMTLVS